MGRLSIILFVIVCLICLFVAFSPGEPEYGGLDYSSYAQEQP